MKRQIFFGSMLSAALAVGVGAQQAGQPTSSQSPSERSSGQTVTVTGCLASATGAAGSATSTPTGQAGQAGEPGQSASSSGAQFILKDASMGSGAGSSTGTTGATPPAGTTGTTSSSASAGKTYRLVGGESENLKQYVNSKVEVTGTLQAAASGAGSTSATGTGTTGSTPTGSERSSSMASGSANQPALRVTSVRKVAGSCTESENR